MKIVRNPGLAAIWVFLLTAAPVFSQFNIQVTINSGSSTTTCGDVIGQPDPFWSVNIQNEGWVTYPQAGSCFNATPYTQYNADFQCFANIPATIEICFKAFENDPNPLVSCDIGEACTAEICQDFPIPPQGNSDFNLGLPDGMESDGEVDFTIATSGIPGSVNDELCHAIDFGILDFNTTIGDISNGFFNNICATNQNEPNPNIDGANWVNNQGVWFQFTTGNNPGSLIKINAISDPANTGDSINLQIALYISDDGSCNGNFTLLDDSFHSALYDESLLTSCLQPNQTYFVLIDGVVDNPPGQLEGYFGLEIQDLGTVEENDLICGAVPLGILPEGGSVSSGLSANVCSSNADDPPINSIGSQQSVWFTFSPPSSGHVFIEGISDLPPPAGDDPINIQLVVFESSDNSCGGLFSQIDYAWSAADLDENLELSCLNPAQNYFILVYGAFPEIDGLFTLHVSDAGDVTPVFSQDVALCAGDGFAVSNNVYTQSGLYGDTLILPTGCDSIVLTNLTVLEEVVIDFTILQTGVGVGNTDGSAVASATGGTGNYGFLWSDGQTESLGMNLVGNATYCVTVTDTNGCNDDSCFVMPFLTNFIPFYLTDTLNCFGDSGGVISLSATSGTPPYSFNWINSSSTLTGAGSIEANGEFVSIGNLPADQYSITISDVNFDTTFSVEILQPPSLNLGFFTSQNASCFGECDGRLTVQIGGGTPPYQLNWSNGNSGDSLNLLCAGAYLLTVTDANSCLANFSFSISEPDEFVATATQIQAVSCFEGNDGRATVTTNGTPLQFAWDTGDSTEMVSGLAEGTYSVTVTNSDGCSALSSVAITAPSEAVAVVITEKKPISCFGDSDGALEATISGPGDSFAWHWSQGGRTAVAENISAGTYFVTVTNDKGCTAFDSLTVSEPSDITASFSTVGITCDDPPDAGVVLIENVTGGTPPYSFSKDGITFVPDPILERFRAGMQPFFVSDDAGCVKEYSAIIEGPPDLAVSLGGDLTLNLGDSVFLEATTNFDGLTYIWEPAEQFNCGNCDAEEMLKPLETMVVKVTILDEPTHCRASDQIRIKVVRKRRVFIPNAFTPNGDGRNDFFTVYGGSDVRQIKEFKIFDRNGALVFTASNFMTEDPNNSWNGTFKGRVLDPAVFVWFAEIEFIDGKTELFSGDVLLAR